jgi:hypothetical protein
MHAITGTIFKSIAWNPSTASLSETITSAVRIVFRSRFVDQTIPAVSAMPQTRFARVDRKSADIASLHEHRALLNVLNSI